MENISSWDQFHERKQSTDFIIDKLNAKIFSLRRDAGLTFLTVAGPAQRSGKLFLTVESLRVDRQSATTRLSEEDLGKCLNGEGRRGDGISFGEIPVCLDDCSVRLGYIVFFLAVFFFIYIHFLLQIIVYIPILAFFGRTGTYCICNNGFLI